MREVLLATALIVIGIGTLGCSPSPTNKPRPAAANSVPRLPLAHWSYDEITDPMTDAKIRVACTLSLNTVSLNPPYHDVKAQLCIRDKPSKKVDAFLRLEGDGQILCDIEYCFVEVRFDKEEEERMTIARPSDLSSNVIFFDPASYFALRMWKKKNLLVQLRLYENGTQTIRFDISDYHGPWAYEGK